MKKHLAWGNKCHECVSSIDSGYLLWWQRKTPKKHPIETAWAREELISRGISWKSYNNKIFYKNNLKSKSGLSK